MAIQKLDPGGEYYFSTGVNTPGVWFSQLNASLSNAAPAGRLTSYSIQMSSNGNVNWQLGSAFAHLISGGAFFFNTGLLQNNGVFLSFLDGTSTQVDVRTNASGNFFFTRNGTTLGSASSNAIMPDAT